jgi:beta-aspartyl-peptidase (threonine type)
MDGPVKVTLGSLCFFGVAALFAMRGGYLKIRQQDDEDKDSIGSCDDVSAEERDDFCIVLHGGAGVISKNIDSAPHRQALSRIISQAYSMAKSTQYSALDIAEYVVVLLEDEHLFNAGKGAVYTSAETHELEAGIMDGSNLKCGAVSLVRNIRNPISLARAVMDHTKYCYMVSEEAFDELAEKIDLEKVDQTYYHTQRRLEQVRSAKKLSKAFLDHDLDIKPSPSTSNKSASPSNTPLTGSRDSEDASLPTKVNSFTRHNSTSSTGTSVEDNINKWHPGSTGTVGCVVMYGGHVAAATSTGGMTNKPPGRIGDSPLIGAGKYMCC